MKHRSINQLKDIAEISPICTLAPMSFSQRLARWAQLLESHVGELQLLRETEFKTKEQRNRFRQDRSPISVAFADPVFRAYGLNGDTYGDAKGFFRLGDTCLHSIVCTCFYRGSYFVSADLVASKVRSLARQASGVERVLTILGLGWATRSDLIMHSLL